MPGYVDKGLVLLDIPGSVLQDFEQYRQAVIKFESFIVSSNRPLCISNQLMLAIMASKLHQCEYLVRSCENKLTEVKEEHDYISQDNTIPNTFKGILCLNKLLAHRPWAVDGHVIKRAVRYDANNPLSIGELMHAIYILIHFHTLSGFVYGCGMEGAGVELMGHCSLSRFTSLYSLFETVTNENRMFDKFTNVLKDKVFGDIDNTAIFKNHYENRYCYRPMRMKEKLLNHISLSLEQFNWEFCGLEIADILFPDSSSYLESKFTAAKSACPNQNNDKSDSNQFDVKEDAYKPLRNFIWEYVQNLYGVVKYETKYESRKRLRKKSLSSDQIKVSVFKDPIFDVIASKSVRQYIKIISTSPELITKSDFENVLAIVSPSILIMINIVIREARFQCELLYALRAVHLYWERAAWINN